MSLVAMSIDSLKGNRSSNLGLPCQAGMFTTIQNSFYTSQFFQVYNTAENLVTCQKLYF